MKRTIVLAALLAAAAGPALAQGGPPARTRGTIESVDARSMVVTDRHGKTWTVALGDKTRIGAVKVAGIDEIKPDSFIGTTAVTQPDGTFKALEVHVFPPAMRGTGEGHYAWDLGPSTTMTNGTVGSLVGTKGRTMTVRYKGGEQSILVPDDVPIVDIEPGSRALLTPGAHVIVFAPKTADGPLQAIQVTVGENGIVPPM